jgi:hypothetical protein
MAGGMLAVFEAVPRCGFSAYQDFLTALSQPAALRAFCFAGRNVRIASAWIRAPVRRRPRAFDQAFSTYGPHFSDQHLRLHAFVVSIVGVAKRPSGRTSSIHGGDASSSGDHPL